MALFTLVVIAGEDDLEAPDLCVQRQIMRAKPDRWSAILAESKEP